MSEDPKPSGQADKQTGLPWDTDEEMKKTREREDAARTKMSSNSPAEILKRPLRTAQGYLDLVALYQSEHATPPAVGPNATEEEKAADRERRLAAPTTKHRRIFSQWPRDPSGGTIRPENSKLGKMAPNKVQFWGATLFDFFYVRRIPDCPYLATISTGSKLSGWMREQGEYYAKDQMAKAEREPAPAVFPPYPVDRLLKDLEAVHPLKSKGKEREGTLQFGRNIPFSSPTPTLQDWIPLHLLPKNLVVHDPFKALSTLRSRSHPPNWVDKPDVVSAYRLELSDDGRHKLESEEKAAQFADILIKTAFNEFMKNPTAEGRTLERGFLYIPQGTKPGPCAPAVYFLHEPRPMRHAPPEAHLYITHHELTGTGHHSVVYNVEWELPRHVLVDDRICKKCVFERGIAMLEAEDGPNGETKDPKWLERTGRVTETVNSYPGFSLAPFDAEGECIRDVDGTIATYDIEPPSRTVARKYAGPVRVIDTKVHWQNADLGSFCEHLRAEREGESLTVRVKVVAKMSLEGDAHLEREAKNYQEFPRHFFEHWSGYNVLPPLHDPVPVGALVPQFYGYYVPDTTVPVRIWERDQKDGRAKENEVGDIAESKEGGPPSSQGVEPSTTVGRDGGGAGGEGVEDKEEGKETGEEGETETKDGGNEESRGDHHKEHEDDASSCSVLDEYDSGADENLPKDEVKKLKEIPEYYTYRSPLLLIESCGQPICDTLEDMTIDDRQHCASLFFRMHHEGWIHGSTYTRNVLYQPGPLSESPSVREENATKRPDLRQTSFRLIDFGRSVKYDGPSDRGGEEAGVTNTFRILHMS